MAQHLTEILGEQLLSTTLDGLLPTQLPSPEVGTPRPQPRLYRGFHTPHIAFLHVVPFFSSYTLTALGHRVCLENAWHSLRITLFLQPSPSSSLLILQELAHMPPTLPTQVKMKLSLLWASTRVFHLCRL